MVAEKSLQAKASLWAQTGIQRHSPSLERASLLPLSGHAGIFSVRGEERERERGKHEACKSPAPASRASL